MNTKHPQVNVTKRDLPSAKLLDEIKLSGTKPLGPAVKGEMVSHQPLSPTYAQGQERIAKLTEEMNELAIHQIAEENTQATRNFWIFTSRVVDRLFLILFTVAFIISSSLIFMQVPDHYELF